MEIINDAFTIYESSNYLIQRIKNPITSEVYIKKSCKDDNPETVKYLKNEYLLLKELDSPYIIKALNFENTQDNTFLILEDFAAVSLHSLLEEKKLKISTFLDYALMIVEGLKDLHSKGIIHKDLNPSNILINEDTQTIKLIDLGLAFHLDQNIDEERGLEGTIEYISPEQTGHFHSKIDFRSDIYALGISFYEMLCGSLPFIILDPSELVHAHLAKIPVSPYEKNQKLPEILSQMVMKMIAKNPDDRYQSVIGLKKDLEKCRFVLTENNEIPAFHLAEDDYNYNASDVFIDYLSDTDLLTIDADFSEMLSGKSIFTLISHIIEHPNPRLNRLIKDLGSDNNCLIIELDFQDFKKDNSHNLLKIILEQVFNYLIYKTGDKIKWKRLLEEKLDENTRLLLELYPPSHLILGDKAELKKISVIESKRRYFTTFKTFFALLATREMPFVFILNNAQFADQDAHDFIKECFLCNELQYAYLLYDYHLNSYLDISPLSTFIEQNENIKSEVRNLILQDLDQENIASILMNKFLWSDEEATEIALLMFRKTLGNPYFLNILLKKCFTEKIIYLNYELENYVCDIISLQSVELAKNIIDTLLEKLNELDEKKQSILFICANFEHTFNDHKLITIGNFEKEELAENLHFLIREDFLKFHSINENETLYEFSHDKIRNACLLLLNCDKKDKYYLELFNFYHNQYLKHYLESDSLTSSLLYQIADFINKINDHDILKDYNKIKYMFNVLAGQKSKTDTSYNKSYDYYKNAINHYLNTASNTSFPENFFDALNECAELALINNDQDYLEKLISIGLVISPSPYYKVKLLESKIRNQLAMNELNESLKTGLNCLEILGMRLSENPSKTLLLTEYLKTKFTLDRMNETELENILGCDDKNKILMINVLLLMSVSSYICNPNLLALIIFKATRLILKGCPVEGIHFLSGYSMILCGNFNDFKNAHKYADLAKKLIDKSKSDRNSFKTLFVIYAFVTPWKKHINQSLNPLLNIYLNAYANGDLEYTSNAAVTYTYLAFLNGDKLDALLGKVNEFNLLLQRLNQTQIYLRNILWYQAMTNFYQINNNPLLLNSALFDETDTITEIYEHNNKTAIFDFCIIKMILGVYFYQFDEAYGFCAEAHHNVKARTGSIIKAYFLFYESLLLLNLSPDYAKINLKKRLNIVKKNQKKLALWTKLNPELFKNKYYLIEAESHRVLKKYVLAEKFFEEAIKSAQENSFIHEEALTKEMLAKLYLEKNQIKFASLLFEEAISLYQSWNAENKVAHLRNLYSEILITPLVMKEKLSVSSTSKKDNAFFEIDAILKTYKAVSGEMNINNLQKKLISIILHHSGANKGLLLIKQDEELIVKAESNIDEPEPRILEGVRLRDFTQIPHQLIRRLSTEESSLVIDNICSETIYNEDVYFHNYPTKSLLFLPVMIKNTAQAFLYLENQYIEAAFSKSKLPLLELIASQFAASLETASLYENIEQSEEKYRTLVDNLKDGVFIIQNKQFQYVNKGLLNIIGKRSEDVIGHDYIEFIAPEDRALVLTNNVKYFEGDENVFEYEINLMHHLGHKVPIHLNAGIITFNNREALEGTIKDITERKNAENLQQIYNDKLKKQIALKTKDIKNLLDNAGQGFLSFPESLIIDNEYSKECINIFKEDISQRDFIELLFSELNEDERQTNREIFYYLFNTENRLKISALFAMLPDEVTFKNKFLKLDYKLIDDVDFKKCMLIITDISDKKLLEKEMEIEKNNLKMVVKAISDSSLIKKSFNEYRQFFKQDIKELIYSDLSSQDKVSQIFRRVHTFKGDFSQCNMIYVSEKLMNVEDLLSELIRVDKNQTNDELFNLLCSTNYYDWIQHEVEIIKDKIGKDIFDDSETLIVEKKNILLLEEFIKQNYSYKESGLLLEKVRALRYMNINDIISSYSEYIMQIADRLGKQLYEIDFSGDEILIDYDIYYDFSKVLLHLFKNMVDHGIETPEDRVINFNKDEFGKISVKSINHHDEYFSLEISDDGKGIDPELIRNTLKKYLSDNSLKHLLTPLFNRELSLLELNHLNNNELLQALFIDGFSTKEDNNNISGRGVGLSAVKEEIEKLGGEIKIESELHKGSKFFIKLPFIKETNNTLIHSERIAKIFNQQLIGFFKNNLAIELEEIKRDKENIELLELYPISAFIDIDGMCKSRVLISMNESLASEAMKNMLYEETSPEEFSLLLYSSIAEILNIIIGNSLGDLEQENIILKINTPHILSTNGIQKYHSDRIWFSIVMHSQFGELLLAFTTDDMEK